jgi:hypothetical protein
MPEDSPNHLASSLNHNQRELLERRYPRAGHRFNMLPTHPSIHGVNVSRSMVPRTRVPRRLNDLVPPLLDTPLHGATGECTIVCATSNDIYLTTYRFRVSAAKPHARCCIDAAV